MSVKQKRFGISINEELYKIIEELSRLYNLPRSKVIELLLVNSLNNVKIILDEQMEALVQLTFVTTEQQLPKLLSIVKEMCYPTTNVITDPFSKKLVFLSCYLTKRSNEVKSILEKVKGLKHVTYLINVLKVK